MRAQSFQAEQVIGLHLDDRAFITRQDRLATGQHLADRRP